MNGGDAGAPSGRGPGAAIVLTGDELLRGFVREANVEHLARSLRGMGLELVSVQITGDRLADIQEALTAAARRAGPGGLVVACGGLGPTHDDRTSEAFAAVAGLALELRDDALRVVEARVRAHGRMQTPDDAARFAPGNRKQATLPAGADMLDPVGTAPGYVIASTDGGPVWAVLPGPPTELRHAWREAARTPAMRDLVSRAPIRRERLVRAWGLPESHAAETLRDVGHVDDAACTATLCARDGELELSVRGTDAARVDDVAERVSAALGDAVFARDDERPIATMVGEQIAARDATLAVAESCTAGMLGALLTEEAGSSDWFVGGMLTYTEAMKCELLGISSGLIDRHGAISCEVACAMAAGVRHRAGSTVGVAITGLAGPGGGTPEQPVGTVHVAVEAAWGTVERRFTFTGGRAAVRRRSCTAALHMVRQLVARP